MMSRGFMFFPPVFEIPLAERLPRGSRYLAMLAPWVKRVVKQEPRHVRQGLLRNGFGCVEQRWFGQDGPNCAHAYLLAEFQEPLFGDHPAPFIDLVGDIDLDRTHLAARPAERG